MKTYVNRDTIGGKWVIQWGGLVGDEAGIKQLRHPCSRHHSDLYKGQAHFSDIDRDGKVHADFSLPVLETPVLALHPNMPELCRCTVKETFFKSLIDVPILLLPLIPFVRNWRNWKNGENGENEKQLETLEA